MSEMDRRGFIKLAGLGGGIVFASSLGLNTLGSVLDYANGSAGKKVEKDFYLPNFQIRIGVSPDRR